ncbi:MAG: hypothetical protein ACJ8FY_18130 [Gemmataceae bacterium]
MPTAKQKTPARPKADPKTRVRGNAPTRKTRGKALSAQDDLLAELAATVDQPALWLDAPNPLFGGRIPSQMIGTPDEHLLREWIGSVKHGMPS